jgi:hypothetical protein
MSREQMRARRERSVACVKMRRVKRSVKENVLSL